MARVDIGANAPPSPRKASRTLKGLFTAGVCAVLILTTLAVFLLPVDAVSEASLFEQDDPALPPAALLTGSGGATTFTSATGIGAAGSAGGSGFDPPVVDQGGNCIQGYVIDVYAQKRGGDGWQVTVTRDDGTVIGTTGVAATGDFHIPPPGGPLGAGTYTVELTYPGGWRPFTPAIFKVTLSGIGPNCAQVRFKMEALACLEVIKLDNRGNMDFKERIGLPGWEFTASSGGTVLTEVTDGKGRAYFRDLIPGDWLVAEEDKVGWQLAPGETNPRPILLESPRSGPGACESLTFINEQVDGSFIRVVKKDIYGNPLRGWIFRLIRKDGTWPSHIGETDSSGVVYFTGLALGEWIVHEEAPNPGFVDPTWWRAIDPITKTVVLEKPEEGKEVNFVNEPLGCVDGYKINHFEQGLGGWQINATNASTGEVVSDVTDPGGYFQLRLRLGAWTISEVVQDGWVAVTAPDFTILVARPFTCEHVRFKNRTDFACVDVYKKDAYDAAGLPGWVINLQPAYGGVAKFDVTDGTGWVRFNELSPGEYIVSHDPLPGWMPAGPTATPITLIANGTCSVVTFYNR
jgi:hypothetical protein